MPLLEKEHLALVQKCCTGSWRWQLGPTKKMFQETLCSGKQVQSIYLIIPVRKLHVKLLNNCYKYQV